MSHATPEPTPRLPQAVDHALCASGDQLRPVPRSIRPRRATRLRRQGRSARHFTSHLHPHQAAGSARILLARAHPNVVVVALAPGRKRQLGFDDILKPQAAVHPSGSALPGSGCGCTFSRRLPPSRFQWSLAWRGRSSTRGRGRHLRCQRMARHVRKRFERVAFRSASTYPASEHTPCQDRDTLAARRGCRPSSTTSASRSAAGPARASPGGC
jgi:hypothetical protein